MFHFHKVAQVHYLGEVDTFFMYVYKCPSCLQKWKNFIKKSNEFFKSYDHKCTATFFDSHCRFIHAATAGSVYPSHHGLWTLAHYLFLVASNQIWQSEREQAWAGCCVCRERRTCIKYINIVCCRLFRSVKVKGPLKCI